MTSNPPPPPSSSSSSSQQDVVDVEKKEEEEDTMRNDPSSNNLPQSMTDREEVPSSSRNETNDGTANTMKHLFSNPLFRWSISTTATATTTSTAITESMGCPDSPLEVTNQESNTNITITNTNGKTNNYIHHPIMEEIQPKESNDNHKSIESENIKVDEIQPPSCQEGGNNNNNNNNGSSSGKTMFANLRKWSTIETPVSPLFQRRKGSIKVEATESSSSNINNNNKEEEEEKNEEKGIIKEQQQKQQQQENNTEKQQDKEEEELNDGMGAETEEVEVQVEPGPSQEGGGGGGGKKIFANFRKWSSFEAPVSPLFNRKKATIKEEKAGSSSSSDKKDNDDDDHHDEEELDSAEGSDDKQESNDDQDPKDKQERKKEEEEEEEEDLDKLLNDMDIDKDFDMWKSFKQRMESSPEKGERGGRQSLAMSEDEAHAYWQARVERDEVYSKRYRPTKEEQKELQEVATFVGLQQNSDGGWLGLKAIMGGDSLPSLQKLLQPAQDHPKSILLKRGPVWYKEQEFEMLLFTQGFILAKVEEETRASNRSFFQRTYETCKLWSMVDFIKAVNDKEKPGFEFHCKGEKLEFSVVSTNCQQYWLRAVERIVIEHCIHNNTYDVSKLGWQYRVIRKPAFTAVVANDLGLLNLELLIPGIELNETDSYNTMAPLHYALNGEDNMVDANIVQALLKAGADPNLKDGEDRTPMYYGA